MIEPRFPAGWDAERVKRLIDHYGLMSEEEQAADDEAAVCRKPGMSQEPRYLPWVGDHYCSGGVFGVRLLLLGESMYERPSAPLPSSIVPDMISSILRGQWAHRFYTTTHRTIGGVYDLRTFWHSVMFYNFVQCPVGERARQRPSTEAWLGSRAALVSVVDRHKPQAVLVLGKQLWKWLVGLGLVQPTGEQVGKLAVGMRADAAYIHHPSSRGFSRQRWTGPAVAFIAAVRQQLSLA